MAKAAKRKKLAKAVPVVAVKKRNPLALNPIMLKGGAHIETHKSKRKKAKMDVKKALSRLTSDGAFFMRFAYH